MLKTTIYGLPLNPMSALDQLAGASFCVSYGTRDRLGRQLDDAIRLVGSTGILLVDNGAFSAHKAGVDTMTDDSYLEGFAEWANDILDRCPQAWVVLPDVIGGTVSQNGQLACETITMFDPERAMPVWHLHESLTYLLHLCESFNYVAFGSSGQYWKVGTPAWHARVAEAFAAIDQWEATSNGAYIRPRLHLMRAQSEAHRYPFDSSDSVNVARNHNRQRKNGATIAAFAARVDAKIQASAGRQAEHQAKRPLLDHLDVSNANVIRLLERAGYRIAPQYRLDLRKEAA